MNLQKIPVRKLARVFHVGTLNAQHKGRGGPSHEGNGLSVSLHPNEWSDIARLGGETFTLTRSGGAFLDFRKLSESQLAELEAWGAQNGWLTKVTLWRFDYIDSETEDERYMFCNTLAEAEGEAEDRTENGYDDEGHKLTEVTIPALSDKARERIGFKQDDIFALDMAAAFLVEDCTELDGVWWNDRLDPGFLSAPRGVIVLSRLPSWTVASGN